MDTGLQEAIRFLRNARLLEAILTAARAGDLAGQAEDTEEDQELAA